jgi:hypothetical protein
VWVQLPGGAAGRAYFGFGASSSGTLSVVLAADTSQLILQDNSGYGGTNVAAVSQSYVANHWYLLSVAWATGGSITGRLYDSNGTTLLNSVQGTDNKITAGGIAFHATMSAKYFDTVSLTHSVSSSQVLAGGAGRLEATTPSSPSSPPSSSEAIEILLYAEGVTSGAERQALGAGYSAQTEWLLLDAYFAGEEAPLAG